MAVDYDKVATQIDNSMCKCNGTSGKPVFINHFTPVWDTTLAACNDEGILCVPTPDCDVGTGQNGNPFLNFQAHVAPESSDLKPVQCIFDRNKLTSLDQVNNSIKLFGPNNPLVKAFCQTKTSTCPKEMPTGCSRYFSTGKDGDYCRGLFNDMTNAEKDIAIMNYCSRNDTEDCKCANRSSDKDYVRLKQGNPFSDACWYIPCANGTRYLVPSEFNDNPDCPGNICQIVFDIAQAHDVDIDHVKADINCDFSGGHYPTHNPMLWYYVAGLIIAGILLLVFARRSL